jgi:hypothetical protein
MEKNCLSEPPPLLSSPPPSSLFFCFSEQHSDVHWGVVVEHRLDQYKSVWEFGASPYQALPFPAPPPPPPSKKKQNEVIHFLSGGGYYHGSFHYDSKDSSMTVCLYSTSMFKGIVKKVYSKKVLYKAQSESS